MITTRLPLFAYWTEFTPTIPKVYWNVYSQEDRIKKICCEIHKMTSYTDMLTNTINEVLDEINELDNEFQDFIEHGFEKYYAEQIAQWVQDNMADIMNEAMRIVYFGLTQDGYFVGYVPVGNAWDDINFDTGADYNNDNYGRLMLYYNVDNSPERWQENG